MLHDDPMPLTPIRQHYVRELVCTYRPARDPAGHIARIATLTLEQPRAAARALQPLLAGHAVEVFGVACLSARHRLLAWHVVSRGTRCSAPVHVPDVFLPAVITPGTTDILVAHNHPSGDPQPSGEDVALTSRLCAAATLLGIPLLDHLIVGDDDQYYSFRETGLLSLVPRMR